jgi:hypothetical protein
MKNKLSTLRWALILSVLVLSGCAPNSAKPTEVPKATPTQLPMATPTQVALKTPLAAVTISPTSGPLGTLVQVVANGFAPNTLVSIAVAPENSEYSQAAQGTTDANGTFAVQVPAEGAPGMVLIFAVAAEGQPVVYSPDLFHILEPSEPAVTISPTSGPLGTLVQVVANGFAPNTLVSIAVAPANSEYSQAAQGTTDANGAFTVQVPAEGAPGMVLIFAVAAEGQPVVFSPDLFHITSAGPTAIPEPSPTPYQDMWITFSNLAYAISLQYPADWQPVPGYGSPETGETKFAAINGFFQIGAMDTDSIDQAAAAEAEHKLRPYGAQPTIETLQVQGQEARLILPSSDQPASMQNQAAIIIHYPQPVNVIGTPCRYFVLWADWPHIRTFAKTLSFIN